MHTQRAAPMWRSAVVHTRTRSGAALPPAVYRSAWPDKAVARVCQSAFAHECDGTVVGRRGGFLLGTALTEAPARESRADVSDVKREEKVVPLPRLSPSVFPFRTLSLPTVFFFPFAFSPVHRRRSVGHPCNRWGCDLLPLYPRSDSTGGRAGERSEVADSASRHRMRRTTVSSQRFSSPRCGVTILAGTTIIAVQQSRMTTDEYLSERPSGPM